MLSTPSWLSLAGIRVVERFLGDIVLTKEELLGLQQELLLSRAPATASQSVADWLISNGDNLGSTYINDIHRHFGAGASEPIAAP